MFKVAGHLAAVVDEPGIHPGMTSTVALVDDKLRITLVDSTDSQTEAKSYVIDIDPALVYELPDICSGYLGRDLGIQLVWDSERFNTRDAGSSVADRKSIPDVADSKFVIGFVNGECYVVMCVPMSVAPQDVPFEVRQHNNAPRDWLGQQSIELAGLVKRNRAKRTALAHIKPLDSIAELEKQVDLLSELVFASLLGGALPAWFEEFKATVKAHSSIRSEADCLASIAEHKAAVRSIQQAYFAARG